MTLDLKAMVAEAHKTGWAVGSGAIEMLQWQVATIEAAEVPIRKGDPPVSLLRPVSEKDAHPNSLSAQYGTGAQPLHTDGAHLPDPPDILILACETPSSVSTKLWRNATLFAQPVPSFLRHGVFAVLAGRNSFYATAHENRRFRYDPGCMVPCDKRAREAVEYFETALSDAVEHHWAEPNTILVIDNRKVLHARSSAAEEPGRQIKRLALRLAEVAK